MKKTVLSLISVFAIVVLLLTACSGGKDEPEVTATRSEITTAGSVTVPTDAQDSGTTASGDDASEPASVQPGAPYGEAAIFDSGNFYMKGSMSSKGDDAVPVELAISGETVYMLSTFNVSRGVDVSMGVLMAPEGKYLVYPAGEYYVELNTTALKIIGLPEDVLGFSISSFAGASTTYVESKQEKYSGKTCDVDVFRGADGSMIERFMDGESLVKIDTYNADGTVQTTIGFDSITANIPSDMISIPSSYTKVSMMKLMNSIINILEED